MPLYDYVCNACGPFDAMRSMAERDTAHCPSCGLQAARAWLHAPRLSGMSGAQRQAHAVNERAQNEPRSSRDGGENRRSHAAGCACCSGASARWTRNQGGRMFAGRRPWMISH